MVFGLVRSGTNGAQLGLEGTHHGMVAIPPTPRADGDSDLLFGRKDSKSNVAEHEAVALETANVLPTLGIIDVKEHCAGVQLVGVSGQAGHGPLVQVNGVLPFGGKEDFLDLLWSDRSGLTFGIVGQLGTKVQEVRDAEEGLGQANLHLHLGGIVFMDPLCRSVKVGMNDMNVSLDWKNITNEGKAPEVVLGLGNSSDGSPMRAKVKFSGWVEK
jgi:hypothetical protein